MASGVRSFQAFTFYLVQQYDSKYAAARVSPCCERAAQPRALQSGHAPPPPVFLRVADALCSRRFRRLLFSTEAPKRLTLGIPTKPSSTEQRGSIAVHRDLADSRRIEGGKRSSTLKIPNLTKTVGEGFSFPRLGLKKLSFSQNLGVVPSRKLGSGGQGLVSRKHWDGLFSQEQRGGGFQKKIA